MKGKESKPVRITYSSLMASCDSAEKLAAFSGHTRLSIYTALAGIVELDKKREDFRGSSEQIETIRKRIKSIKKQLQEVSDEIG